MFLGLRRDAAARFTFLLAIPAMLAAAGKEGLELRHMHLTSANVQMMAIGVVVSALVGYLTIKYLPALPRRKSARRLRLLSLGARGRNGRLVCGPVSGQRLKTDD